VLEREMEDLIATYPDDFFPGRGFKLKGRQQSYAGVGRFDLLFEDRFQLNVLMELKSEPAKFGVADQLARYYDELRNRGTFGVLMWLVAPQIPYAVREFLDRIGIEYSEIHRAEFLKIANLHGIALRAEVSLQSQSTEPVAKALPKTRRSPKGGIVVDFCLEFIKRRIHHAWEQKQEWITRDDLAIEIYKQPWAVEALDARKLFSEIKRISQVGNWVDWFSSYYTDGKYALKEEFEQLKIARKWAYRPRQNK